MNLTEIRKCKRCGDIIEMPDKSITCELILDKYVYIHKCGVLSQYGDAVKCRYGKTKIIGYKRRK